MPGWMMKSYQVSHFLALLPPATFSFIFHGSDFFTLWESVLVSQDREVLIETESDCGADNDCVSVSLE